MPANPQTPEFWANERKLLGQHVDDLLMRIIIAGATSGVELLPPNIAVLVDWDVFNRDAVSWLRRYLGDSTTRPPFVGDAGWNWAQNLTDTTRRNVMEEIDRWIQEGEPLPVLEKRLARLPTFGSLRARQVAVTEVTRVYASGNLMAWQSSGMVGAKRWRTAVDERVCPICGPMHDTIVEIDAEWQFTQEMRDKNPALDRALKGLKQTAFTAPPAHVLCRCHLIPVVLEAYEPGELDDQRFDKPVDVEPIPKLEEITTSRQAIRYLESRWPATSWDLSNVDDALSRSVASELDRLMGKYRDVAANLRYVGTYQDASNPIVQGIMHRTTDPFGTAIAHASRATGQRIGLNPKYFGNADKFMETLDRMRSSNWTDAGNDIESIIAHEFGHLVDGNMWNRSNGRLVGNIVRADGSNFIHTMYEEFDRKFRARSKTLSEYATTEKVEAFAEGFAQMERLPKSQWSAYTKRLYNRVNNFDEYMALTNHQNETHLMTWREADDHDRAIFTSVVNRARELMGF